jgi:hypothetical protein
MSILPRQLVLSERSPAGWAFRHSGLREMLGEVAKAASIAKARPRPLRVTRCPVPAPDRFS